MADSHSKLEINSKVVDLGDRVIQLHHVVSAGRHASHPFRAVGLVLIAIAIALVAGEAALRGAPAFRLQSGGSLPLWIGFAAAGIGLFLALFARRLLVIRTSDGARIVLPAADEASAAALISQLRRAMEGAHSGGTAGTAPQSLPPLLTASDQVPGGRPAQPLGLPQQVQAPLSRASGMEAGQPQTVPASRVSDGYVNGHASRGAFPSAADGVSLAEATARVQRSAAASQTAPAGGLGDRRPGAEALRHSPPIREQLSLPAMPPAGLRDDGSHDLALLMDHVRRANVQHKEALLDLLRVVEDFYKGRASREDAVAHWRSFADYVTQYLGGVDGLLSHTERFGRHMQPR